MLFHWSSQKACGKRTNGAMNVRDLGLAAADDETIFDHADRDQRVIVSANNDFGTILAMRNTAADALPAGLGSVAVSPDVTQAAVVEHARDAVAVVDLATGRVEPVAAATGDAKCGTLPAWRNDRKLLIQTRRLNGAAQDTWAIWQRGKPLRWLDDTWTDVEEETLPHIMNGEVTSRATVEPDHAGEQQPGR